MRSFAGTVFEEMMEMGREFALTRFHGERWRDRTVIVASQFGI